MHKPKPYGRWADSPQPVVVSTPNTYSGKPEGPIRRAELRAGDHLLGHVWTDDQQAAGFLDEESAGAAGVHAGAKVWAVLRDAHQAGKPASEILDPALYAPSYKLVAAKDHDTGDSSKDMDAAIRARGRKPS